MYDVMFDVIDVIGKFVLVLIGMSFWVEIDGVMSCFFVLKVVFQCILVYLCLLEKIGFNLLGEFLECYSCFVGFFDYSVIVVMLIVVVVLGVELFEVYVVLFCDFFGFDMVSLLLFEELVQFFDGVWCVCMVIIYLIDKDEVVEEMVLM